MSGIKLFISHSHRDEKLAEHLLNLINHCLEVPSGAIRCSSVSGFELELGALLSTELQKELKSALHVVALLTPNSIDSPWVLFELGAVWGLARSPLPMFAGELGDEDLPGPLRNVVAGRLDVLGDLEVLIQKLHEDLDWPRRHSGRCVTRESVMADFAKDLEFPIDNERRTSFAARLANIGGTQNELLRIITSECRKHGFVTQAAVKEKFTKSTDVYYRLEQLRYLGFITKKRTKRASDGSRYQYFLTPEYKTEISI